MYGDSLHWGEKKFRHCIKVPFNTSPAEVDRSTQRRGGEGRIVSDRNQFSKDIERE